MGAFCTLVAGRHEYIHTHTYPYSHKFAHSRATHRLTKEGTLTTLVAMTLSYMLPWVPAVLSAIDRAERKQERPFLVSLTCDSTMGSEKASSPPGQPFYLDTGHCL